MSDLVPNNNEIAETTGNGIRNGNGDGIGSLAPLIDEVRGILLSSRNRALQVVNAAMVSAYWEIGRAIVQEEQRGASRADYGKRIIETLAERLTEEFGRGFATTNLKMMRQFHLTFPIRHALRDELTWTHYRLLMRVENEKARGFYEAESVNAGWSTRELKRQRETI